MTDPKFFDTSVYPWAIPYKRGMHAMTWHDGQMYLAFGWDGTWDYTDVWRTLNGDPRGTWKRIMGSENGQGDMIWQPRSYVLGTSFNGEIHWLGGYQYGATGNVIKEHVSTKDGHSVSIWQAPPWEAREAQMTAVLNNKLYMIGGITYLPPLDSGPPGTLRAFDDAWSLNLDGDWTQEMTGAPWGKIRNGGALVHGGVIHIFGGFNSQNVLQNCHYTWDGINAPVQLPDMPIANGSFFYFELGGRIWMLGGSLGSSSYPFQHDSVYSWDSVNGWVQHADFPGGITVGQRAAVAPAAGGNPDEAFIIYPAHTTPSWSIKAQVWGATFDGTTLVWTRHTGSTLDTDP